MAQIPASARQQTRFKLALAVPVGRGLAYLGWTDDPEGVVSSLSLFFDSGESTRLPFNTGAALLVRTPRPADPSTKGERRGGGFAIWVPDKALKGGQLLITLNDQAADAARVVKLDAAKAIAHADLLETYGNALAALARSQRDSSLAKLLEKPLADLAARRGSAFGYVEQAWAIAGQLLVIARISCEPGRVESIRYRAGRGRPLDISAQVQRFPLPTHKDVKGKALPGHVTGICFVLPITDLPHGDKATLLVSVAELGELELPLKPLEGTLESLPDILIARPQVYPIVIDALRKQLRGAAGRRELAALARQCFDGMWPRTTNKHNYGNNYAAAINGAYALGDGGLAIFGVLLRPEGTALRIYLHAEERAPVELTRNTVFLPIEGDLAPLREKVPASSRNTSFFIHAPMPTSGGERRLLRFVMPGVPEFWLKAETRPLQETGTALVRKILGHIPQSAWLWRNFAEVCDRGLGKIIEQAALQKPAIRQEPRVHEFGTPPRAPWVSIIVPLYGRYDFMRHQLAQFCEDPDFASGIDLMYVVDDPEIETAALNLAARYQPLFEIPLRVITYGENRGFAGANNAAAALARAPMLLLMNSDVLPQKPGWLSTLRRAYEKLPRCGMVAPLLQYPDGSVQHAGMASSRLATYPGLVFNTHPGKGLGWEGGEKPLEQAMLTGACLLTERSTFLSAGGLDEHYVIGDFEDSDLSLKLRASGKRLYLVPASRLWHLERQSQYLGDSKRAQRDLITIYNSWRYTKKISSGLLPDPESLQLGA